MKKLLLLISMLSFLPLYSYAGTTTLNVSTDTEIEESSSTPKSSTICSQEAIEKRDTNLAASRSSYNQAMTNALNDRKNREKAAVALDDENEKKGAIKASVDAYKQQVKVAQNTLTDARKIVWSTFENDIKECREQDPEIAPSKDVSAKASFRKMSSDETEGKSLRETIKAQIENFFSKF